MNKEHIYKKTSVTEAHTADLLGATVLQNYSQHKLGHNIPAKLIPGQIKFRFCWALWKFRILQTCLPFSKEGEMVTPNLTHITIEAIYSPADKKRSVNNIWWLFSNLLQFPNEIQKWNLAEVFSNVFLMSCFLSILSVKYSRCRHVIIYI